jgi:putative transposase
MYADDVRQISLEVIQRHLKIEVNGYKCDSEMLINVLLKAAVERISIQAACAVLGNVADSNTIREQVNRALPVDELSSQEEAMNAALTEWLPPDIFRERIQIAIDTHDEPFYGTSPQFLPYSSRGKAKAGTTHFIRVGSAYLIWRQVRLTLAVTYVRAQDSLLDVLKRLLERLRGIGIRWSVLYLDKGFCSTAIIRYLTNCAQQAVIACPIRGKQGGIRALCQGRQSYSTDYTFTDGTTVQLALYASLPRHKKQKRRRKWLAYVLVDVGWSPAEVFAVYRRRFGIECSYRAMRRVKAFTSSRNPALRFFFLGLALLLQNIWLRLRWTVARIAGAGPRRVDPAHFPFQRFIFFLAHAIEITCGIVLSCSYLCPS